MPTFPWHTQPVAQWRAAQCPKPHSGRAAGEYAFGEGRAAAGHDAARRLPVGPGMPRTARVGATSEEKDGKFVLTDHGSRNGTYIRIKSEKPLAHGDYLFLGKKLVRVEMNSN